MTDFRLSFPMREVYTESQKKNVSQEGLGKKGKGLHSTAACLCSFVFSFLIPQLPIL